MAPNIYLIGYTPSQHLFNPIIMSDVETIYNCHISHIMYPHIKCSAIRSVDSMYICTELDMHIGVHRPLSRVYKVSVFT